MVERSHIVLFTFQGAINFKAEPFGLWSGVALLLLPAQAGTIPNRIVKHASADDNYAARHSENRSRPEDSVLKLLLYLALINAKIKKSNQERR